MKREPTEQEKIYSSWKKKIYANYILDISKIYKEPNNSIAKFFRLKKKKKPIPRIRTGK
jgi:hypothetical protein